MPKRQSSRVSLISSELALDNLAHAAKTEKTTALPSNNQKSLPGQRDGRG
jgi:hypothetical protein